MDRVGSNPTTWALILAAGEGSRLRPLTMTVSGIAVPKQFCSLRSGPSLLQEALNRAHQIAEPARLCTIVAAQHQRWWGPTLSPESASTVIAQPANRGTAHGVLLPLTHILECDPEARVVVLPSDHHVQDEAKLTASIRAALLQLNSRSTGVLLLGIAPDEPDPELGYILPGLTAGGQALCVERFVEKPSAPAASELIARGALWNAFILAARAAALLDLYRASYADLIGEMRTAVRHDLRHGSSATHATSSLYERLPVLDFSRHILQGQEERLRVWPVAPCGWSDLGTPQRVGQVLRRLPRKAQLLPSGLAGTSRRVAHLDLAAQYERLERGI